MCKRHSVKIRQGNDLGEKILTNRDSNPVFKNLKHIIHEQMSQFRGSNIQRLKTTFETLFLKPPKIFETDPTKLFPKIFGTMKNKKNSKSFKLTRKISHGFSAKWRFLLHFSSHTSSYVFISLSSSPLKVPLPFLLLQLVVYQVSVGSNYGV